MFGIYYISFWKSTASSSTDPPCFDTQSALISDRLSTKTFSSCQTKSLLRTLRLHGWRRCPSAVHLSILAHTCQAHTRSRGRCEIAHHSLSITCCQSGFCVSGLLCAIGTPLPPSRKHNRDMLRRKQSQNILWQVEDYLHGRITSQTAERFWSPFQQYSVQSETSWPNQIKIINAPSLRTFNYIYIQ